MTEARGDKQNDTLKRKSKEISENLTTKIPRIDENNAIFNINRDPLENNPLTEKHNSSRDDDDDDGSIPGSFYDYADPLVPFSEKLAMWCTSRDISEEALSELIEILRSSGKLDSSTTVKKTEPKPKVSKVSTITDNCYVSDSCSTMELSPGVEVKTEFQEYGEANEVNLGSVMVKLNFLESMVCQTNTDVGFIKRTLSRMQDTLVISELNPTEDISDIIPDLTLPVQNIEELVKLEHFLSDADNFRKLVSLLVFSITLN